MRLNCAMAITGAHMLIHTPEPEAVREIFRDVFGLDHVDDGQGWLIFALPPAELGVHPTEPGAGHHEISFMCDDIETTMAELTANGVDIEGPPNDEGWGITVKMRLPGEVDVLIYQPRHNTAI